MLDKVLGFKINKFNGVYIFSHPFGLWAFFSLTGRDCKKLLKRFKNKKETINEI